MSQVAMIDVSANNHLGDEEIDWEAVYRVGYRAVMIKATEGTTYANKWVGVDARGAAAAGLKVGYYHFAHPSGPAAASQATYALSVIAGLPRDLGLALDLETVEGRSWTALASFAASFHSAARTVVKHSPLYTTPDMLDNMPGAPFGERLWLPSTARPRREVWAWQLTSPANIKGIMVPTDVGWLRPDVG